MAFAELGTVVPRSGAEYAYFMDSFGPLHKFWGPLPSFIVSWVYVVILRPAEVAVIVLTFAEYLTQPILEAVEVEDAYTIRMSGTLIAVLTIGIITYINMTSVKIFLKIQNVFSSCKVIVCLIVIGGGIYELARGNVENISKGFEGTNWSAKHISLAFYSGLWAYDGWSTVTTVTEEVKKPEK